MTTGITIEEIQLGEGVRFLLQVFKKNIKAFARKEDIMVEIVRRDTVDTYPVHTGSNVIQLRVMKYGTGTEIENIQVKRFNSQAKEEEVLMFLKGLVKELESWREIDRLYVNSFVNWRRG